MADFKKAYFIDFVVWSALVGCAVNSSLKLGYFAALSPLAINFIIAASVTTVLGVYLLYKERKGFEHKDYFKLLGILIANLVASTIIGKIINSLFSGITATSLITGLIIGPAALFSTVVCISHLSFLWKNEDAVVLSDSLVFAALSALSGCVVGLLLSSASFSPLIVGTFAGATFCTICTLKLLGSDCCNKDKAATISLCIAVAAGMTTVINSVFPYVILGPLWQAALACAAIGGVTPDVTSALCRVVIHRGINSSYVRDQDVYDGV
ncbi:hypothetical protein BIY23_00425 [Wolbachia pipientis]|uniref:Uncharacterized protein n=1 Tax=Wolbachia pipientis TaxID=955 RepID=A0A1E7QKT4_WOLPI|nr:hypothetical protein [Wolbachia pipientis]OEY86956.1 hypothetical protein BIY23_00425 [Wolbachia pipientis]